VKLFQKVLPVNLKAVVFSVIQSTAIGRESRSDNAPIRVSDEYDDDVDITIFPAILEPMILTFRLDSLDLNAKKIRPIRDDHVSLVAMIEDWKEYLPAVIH
jgi:hypothetical protein